MSVPENQFVDLLVKQLYGVAKTDTAVNKSPTNESIASPALNRGDTQWTQSNQIPATAAAVAGIVQGYTGAAAVQCVPDTTTVPVGGIYPTWLTNLTNWIPEEFGSTYLVQAWVDSPGVANPTVTGTQIFGAGSGGIGEYYYDNIAGLLNFIGETIPPALTSGKVIYIVGYRYIGLVGVTNLPSNVNIGNLNFSNTTITSTANSNITISPNGTGTFNVTGVSNLGPAGNVKITGGTNGYYLQTDGAGNLSWAAGGGGGNGSPGGANTEIQFNNAGTFSGVANLTYDYTTSTLNLVGNILANTYTIGTGTDSFSTSNVYAATTSTLSNTALITIPLTNPNIAALDFVIVATDSLAGNRQMVKMSVVTLNSTLNYNESSTLFAGGTVGSFSVSYLSGNAILYVVPESTTLITYKMQITAYYE
jgi:hypothetical protein